MTPHLYIASRNRPYFPSIVDMSIYVHQSRVLLVARELRAMAIEIGAWTEPMFQKWRAAYRRNMRAARER